MTGPKETSEQPEGSNKYKWVSNGGPAWFAVGRGGLVIGLAYAAIWGVYEAEVKRDANYISLGTFFDLGSAQDAVEAYLNDPPDPFGRTKAETLARTQTQPQPTEPPSSFWTWLRRWLS